MGRPFVRVFYWPWRWLALTQLNILFLTLWIVVDITRGQPHWMTEKSISGSLSNILLRLHKMLFIILHEEIESRSSYFWFWSCCTSTVMRTILLTRCCHHSAVIFIWYWRISYNQVEDSKNLCKNQIIKDQLWLSCKYKRWFWTNSARVTRCIWQSTGAVKTISCWHSAASIRIPLWAVDHHVLVQDEPRRGSSLSIGFLVMMFYDCLHIQFYWTSFYPIWIVHPVIFGILRGSI